MRTRWIAATAVTAVVAAACSHGSTTQLSSQARVSTAPPPVSSPSTAASESTASTSPVTTAASSAGPPPYTLAVSKDQEVRLLDTVSATVRRVLARAETGSDIVGLAMSTDSKDFYWGETTRAQPCQGRLWHARLDAPQPDLVTDGVRPAVSPDGQYLAFAARGTPETMYSQCLYNSVRVLDRISGAVVTAWAGDGEYFAGSITWSSNSRSIAFSLTNEGGGSVRYDLDTRSSTRLTFDAVADLFPRAESALRPRWTRDGKVVVGLSCYGCIGAFLSVLGIADDGRSVNATGFADIPTAARDGWVLRQYRNDTEQTIDVLDPALRASSPFMGITAAAWPADAYFVADPARFETTKRSIAGSLRIEGAALVDDRGLVLATPSPPTQVLEVNDGFLVTVPRAVNCPSLVFFLARADGHATQVAIGDGLIGRPDGDRVVFRYDSDKRCVFGYVGGGFLTVAQAPWTTGLRQLIARLPPGNWALSDYRWENERLVATATCTECTQPQTIAMAEDATGTLVPK